MGGWDLGFLSRFSRKEKSQVEEGYNKLEAQSISVYSFMLHHKPEKKHLFFCCGVQVSKILDYNPQKSGFGVCRMPEKVHLTAGH